MKYEVQYFGIPDTVDHYTIILTPENEEDQQEIQKLDDRKALSSSSRRLDKERRWWDKFLWAQISLEGEPPKEENIRSFIHHEQSLARHQS